LSLPRVREAFFDAARTILAAEGAEGLTVAALCRRAQLSTTVFYCWFTDIRGFVEAFAQHWLDRWDSEGDDPVSPPRGREAFLDAARGILAAEGADGLTIAALCRHTYTSTGAFYYWFTGIGEFTDAFAKDWLTRWESVFDRIHHTPAPLVRLQIAAETAIAMPVRLDAAIRAWARTDEVIGAAVRHTDRQARALARDAFTELLGDPERAALLAHMSLALVVGLLMQDEPPDQALYTDCILEWIRSCAGLQVTLTSPADDGPPLVRLEPPAPGSHPPTPPAEIPA
jgi:AcrR family transcriptional regulator